jgi:hypothetical protein
MYHVIIKTTTIMKDHMICTNPSTQCFLVAICTMAIVMESRVLITTIPMNRLAVVGSASPPPFACAKSNVEAKLYAMYTKVTSAKYMTNAAKMSEISWTTQKVGPRGARRKPAQEQVCDTKKPKP